MESSIALALLASALFGTAIVLANVGLRHIDSMQGALVAIPSTLVLYWLLAPFLLRTGDWNALAFSIFALVGLVFPAAVTLLGYESNRLAGPTVTGTLASTTPLFAVVGAVVFLGEPITPAIAAGTAAVVAGVIALSWHGANRPRDWTPWVIALPLAAAAIRGGAQAAVKTGLVLWPDPLVAGLVGYSVSSVMIWAANQARPAARKRAALDRRSMAWFVGVGACNGMAMLAMYAALNHGRVTVVSPLAATYPLVTLALSAIFLRGEDFGPRILLGVALTVGGVFALARG